MGKEINEISVGQVEIRDAFWSRVQERIIDTVIPFQEKVLLDEVEGVPKSHAIENFRIATGQSTGMFYGMVFQDSDVSKWLEGVAYALAVKPDPALEARADAVIELLEQAQQPDGYLDTYFIIKEPEHRWQNLQECHELYCAGHLMEAATAYYQSTGKDRLLGVARRLADHILSRFGEGKERGIPGHQEVEIGLLKLYRATGEEGYKTMARFFLEERGKNPDYFYQEKLKRGWQHWGQYDTNPLNTEYAQVHKPIYEQEEAVGHAVRAVYMYTAMADLAGEDKDHKLYETCRKLWDNIVQRRMYLTGGIGSTPEGEAFSMDYDLPNDMAYAETCASVGMVFFAKRMLEYVPRGVYADVMERELFNGILCGIQLDGKRYFYVNPLEVNPQISGKLFGYRHALPKRPGWYECACCPTNLVRLMTSLGGYGWSESETGIYSHLFLGQRASLKKADITVESEYPWEGVVRYRLSPKVQKPFTLAIHIPGYIDGERDRLRVVLNGKEVDVKANLRDGYLFLHRAWAEGDVVEITFDLSVRKVFANSKVRADAGCIALMRGPLVYCFEEVDNGANLQALRIPANLQASVVREDRGELQGMVLLKVSGYRIKSGEALYSEKRPQKEGVTLTAIPYYAWANRKEGEMRVWMLEGEKVIGTDMDQN